MAESKTKNIARKVCPFYLFSLCKDGDKCKYAHDSECRDPDNVVCSFFLKGICKYGDDCWFQHSNIKENINSTSELKNDSLFANSYQQKGSSQLDLNSVFATNSNCNFRNFHNNETHKKSLYGPNSPNWVNAPEFVPKSNKSYSDVLKSKDCVYNTNPQKLDMELCIHFFEGVCPYNDKCPCLHGDLCELCNKYCLNPFDERQRNRHLESCEKELEQNMEFSFAVQRSMEKTCGICMDVVMEKEAPSERLFGILENCNHVYCLNCIRKWRSVETFEVAQHVQQSFDPVVTRSCPECRVSSYFITPSQYWVDSEVEKKKLIADYKQALSKKPCKYFKQGKGICPFGGACFYQHAKPDGTKVVLPIPSKPRRRQNQDGELDYMDDISLWDFLEIRDDNMIII